MTSHSDPLDEVLASCPRLPACRPWPRVTVDETQWESLAQALARGQATLSGLWGEAGFAHLALWQRSGQLVIATLACPDQEFPSIGRVHPPAIRLERAIADLVGLRPRHAPDLRPWLDHGQWSLRHPLGRPLAAGPAEPYAFLPAEGEGLHRIPVGPVHAGIIEPGHFRFTANGEAVVRLEERLGYVHKGIETLLRGATLDRAARLAGRVSGDSTVAYSVAFARAVEAACGIEVPARAAWLRALMAELERIANHLGDIGAICNDASFTLMHAHCGILRERILQACGTCFGHRLMMDRSVPGGTTVDLDGPGAGLILALVHEIRGRFPELVELYDNTASLQDRTEMTGVVSPALVMQHGCGGFVGRAASRTFDTRRDAPYPPYDELSFEVPVLTAGDVNARIWIRIREVEQSLSLVEQMLEAMPGGATRTDPDLKNGEGIALVEGFRGDILVWLRIRDGRIDRCHLRDPSWFQWPLLEAAIEGNIVADFPLCNKSFNCSYSGHDL